MLRRVLKFGSEKIGWAESEELQEDYALEEHKVVQLFETEMLVESQPVENYVPWKILGERGLMWTMLAVRLRKSQTFGYFRHQSSPLHATWALAL